MKFTSQGALINIAHDFFPEVLAAGKALHASHHAWQECRYAILCAGPADYDLEFAIQLGETQPSQGRRNGDHYEALKQAGALNRKIEKGVLATSQINDIGGAVVIEVEGIETIFSVRGLPRPHDNEAFAMLLMEVFRPDNQVIADRCKLITKMTHNRSYAQLKKALRL